jgi:anti-anti-sigma factor
VTGPGVGEPVGGPKVNDLLQVFRTGTPRTLRLVGELDASNAEGLVESLRDEIETGGDLVLDLSGLGFVDSMGLRSFLRIAAALEASGKLVLQGPQRSVARTIEVIGIEKLPNIAVVEEPPDESMPEGALPEGGVPASGVEG